MSDTTPEPTPMVHPPAPDDESDDDE